MGSVLVQGFANFFCKGLDFEQLKLQKPYTGTMLLLVFKALKNVKDYSWARTKTNQWFLIPWPQFASINFFISLTLSHLLFSRHLVFFYFSLSFFWKFLEVLEGRAHVSFTQASLDSNLTQYLIVNCLIINAGTDMLLKSQINGSKYELGLFNDGNKRDDKSYQWQRMVCTSAK